MRGGKNLLASPFNKDLSNKTTFSLICISLDSKAYVFYAEAQPSLNFFRACLVSIQRC
jgi:hypothetical protein